MKFLVKIEARMDSQLVQPLAEAHSDLEPDWHPVYLLTELMTKLSLSVLVRSRSSLMTLSRLKARKASL